MEAPVDLELTLARPATRAGIEPSATTCARVRLCMRQDQAVRPRLDLWFVVDASASMHRFVLDPDQREMWRRRAEARGEVSAQEADGRRGLVWRGQTLRELQQVVSTPMLSCLRGVWRTLEALHSTDRVCVLAFADQHGTIYEDTGVPEQAVRLEAARTQLTRLGSGVDESGLGRGTRLAGALQEAIQRISRAEGDLSLRRMILVSDGVVEDKEVCRPLVDRAVDAGLVISVIGVGDEFEEEFLMTTADVTRGNYYYAATAPEVEQAVRSELETVTSIVARQALLRVIPTSGAIVREVHPVAPSLSEFQTVWMEHGGWRFRIGDLSPAQPLEFLVELAAPEMPTGEGRLALVQVEGVAPASPDRFAVEAPIRLFYSDDPLLLQAQDDEVVDALRRVAIYREERRFALAAAQGDTEGATRHLQQATRMIRERGGGETLAAEMEAAAGELMAGTRNLARTKRVKAGTRRLSPK